MTTHEKTGTVIAGTGVSGAPTVSGPLPVLTPNRVIAHNLQQARVMHGLTQEQAAERLEPFIGKRWSKASWSAAERSVTGERPREFTIDELIAFACCFELPPRWFMTLPAETREVTLPGATLPREVYVAIIGPQHVGITPATETDTAAAVIPLGASAATSSATLALSTAGGELEDALRDATERVIQLAGAVGASASMRGTLTVDRHEESES